MPERKRMFWNTRKLQIVLQALDWKERNPDARPLFVGDTLHDADVATALGADCVLYCGGHQSYDRLATSGYPVIRDIREIVQYL